jgi:phospholipid/cholesterol/gamma-HCH transport system ATP-binding protein
VDSALSSPAVLTMHACPCSSGGRLDPVVSTRIEDLVRELQRVCPTCVLVTHSFSTVRRTADRVVFLHEGKIRWDGHVRDIDHCDNPYVVQFFSASLEGPMRFKDDALDLEEAI